MTALYEIDNLPHNPQAEKSLVGQTLLDARLHPSAKELTLSDFYSADMRSLWQAIIELDENGEELNPVAVYDLVLRNDPATPLQITDITATYTGLMVHSNPQVFVNKIETCSMARAEIKESFKRIKALTKNPDLVESDSRGRDTFVSLADILEQQVKPKLEKMVRGETDKISTGSVQIDEAIGGGLSKSDMVAIVGDTGSGKSALALWIATNVAKLGHGVAFVSGEMTDEENGLRLLSQASGFINLNSIVQIFPENHGPLLQWLEALKALPIYFDSTTFDLQSLAVSLRKLIKRTGIKLLIIDYTQLFKLHKFSRTQRTERIAEVSQELKRLQMELGIAVIEVLQINREGAKSGKATFHDLEGSGQLEKDCSIIAIIDRDEQDDTKIALRFVKGRNTGRSVIEGRFIGRTLGFEI